jgi:hypothetical protein
MPKLALILFAPWFATLELFPALQGRGRGNGEQDNG